MNARVFDHLIERLRCVAAGLPDRRTGDNTRFSMADIALSAFAVFCTQCPSFLSFQQKMEPARGRNNTRSLFQVERIPTDNHIRQTLDPVEPHHRFSLFDDLHRAFDQTGVLENLRAVGGTRLIALTPRTSGVSGPPSARTQSSGARQCHPLPRRAYGLPGRDDSQS